MSEAAGFSVRSRALTVVSLALLLYAAVAAVTQFFGDPVRHSGVYSLAQFSIKQAQFAALTNMVERDSKAGGFDGVCRNLDLGLPPKARIFMDDMLGPGNLSRNLMYAYATYYLFPREIAVNVDTPARLTRDGYVGRAPKDSAELAAAGFDFELNPEWGAMRGKPLREGLQVKPPLSPAWFPSRKDQVVAFLLPLLTALSGMLLVQVLSGGSYSRMTLPEKLACGLGLGMVELAAFTLAAKLCGAHAGYLPLAATVPAGIAAAWTLRRDFQNGLTNTWPALLLNPLVFIAALVFVLTFSIAGTFGLVESDAVAAWMLKAKILHLFAGHDIIRWFSEPRLVHAHLDYPMLVPSLHAATFDSLGRVNEFVTKFWPAWMLLFLLGAAASWNRTRDFRVSGSSFFLLALLLLPATREYVMMEGGTMPMVFFLSLGLLQCARAQTEHDSSRLGLGLTLLFGAAMTKLEGFIFLFAALLAMLVVPSFRALLKPSRHTLRLTVFWLAAALPFVWLRLHIPALHYESGWAREALAHPLATVANMPGFMLMVTARWFTTPSLAHWNAEGGLHWTGQWTGFDSLYHHPTLGLAWVALGLTVVLWFVRPSRRNLVLFLGTMTVVVLAAFSGLFATFVNAMDRSRALEYYTSEIASNRYLFPLLVAWSTTVVTFLFEDEKLAQAPTEEAAVEPASAQAA